MKLLLVCSGLLISTAVFAEMNEVLAEEKVKGEMCRDGLTISEALHKSVKKRSQRDLGWKVYREEAFFDVERAIQISKSMKIRYRWRVHPDGQVQAVGKRAEKLCAK